MIIEIYFGNKNVFPEKIIKKRKEIEEEEEEEKN